MVVATCIRRWASPGISFSTFSLFPVRAIAAAGHPV